MVDTIRIKITNIDTTNWLIANGYTLDSNNVVVLPIESEYVPNVVMPEDGSDTTPYESLKAQAVISRTIAYYKKSRNVANLYDCDDTSNCQVYKHTSAYSANARVKQSVIDTNGIILKWGYQSNYQYPIGCAPPSTIGTFVIASMYVNGDILSGTDVYVTYNEGKSGECITQTTMGSVEVPPSGNPYNRGCLGQIQSHSLVTNYGYTWQQILKYFYGNDIIIYGICGTLGATLTIF